jgi:hypothetical protein
MQNQYPNTDRYQNGIVASTGIQIYILTDPGDDSMSFVFLDSTARGWNWFHEWFFLNMVASTPTDAPVTSITNERRSTPPPITPNPTNSPTTAPVIQPSSWQMLLSETFNGGGPGSFKLGSNAFVEDKKCGSCIGISRNADTSYAIVEIDVTSKQRFEIVFAFYSDGLKDGEYIIVEFTDANTDNWDRIQTWTSFPNGRWVTASTSWTIMNLRNPSNTLQLRFRSTSEKKRFYIDNVMIRGK